MIYNYDIISKNIEIFNKAVDEISMLKSFIDGKVSIYSLSKLNLDRFGNFYTFLVECNHMPVLDNITWKKLKVQIIETTTTERFKTFIKNRTEKKFISDITNQKDFDRLLNGRIISMSKRGNTRRGGERIEGLQKNSIELINYVIQKEINCDLSDIKKIKWFTTLLDINSVAKREAHISDTISKSVLSFLENEKIDFRKINTDFVINTISDKLKEMMIIPVGTMIKSLEDLAGNYNDVKYLTKDKMYEVESSSVYNGFLQVYITDDNNYRRQLPYLHFEDMRILREDILENLFN